LVSPDGIAFAAGNLYVADAGHGPGSVSGQVLEYNSAGASLQTIAAPGANGLDAATALAFHGGNLYVANATSSVGAGSVLEYNALGIFVGTFATGLTSPTALAFDPLGNLFVADASASTNDVVEYGSTGSLVGTFIEAGGGGLGAPAGLAFVPAAPQPQPVPEPSSLAMFGIAAALASYAGYGRAAVACEICRLRPSVVRDRA
ncbi:MAG: PEP-CTERM sorting domain-containing protein, partial [Candidatus Saccharimonadales bacterium]